MPARDSDLELADQARLHERRFVLMPRSWRSYRGTHPLTWQTVPFRKASRGGIPTHAGVYVFLVRPGIADGLEAAYVMYVGETDNLHRRFGEYLREARDPRGRVKLRDMFRKYPRHLHFTFAYVPATATFDVQNLLIQALWPPVNSELPATMRAAKRVLS